MSLFVKTVNPDGTVSRKTVPLKGRIRELAETDPRYQKLLGVPKKSRRASPYNSGIGDALHAIIQREEPGVQLCEKCLDMIRQLNSLRPEGVREDIKGFAEQIAKRAGTMAPHWWDRIAVRVDLAIHFGHTQRKIEGWINEAISTAKPVKKKRPTRPRRSGRRAAAAGRKKAFPKLANSPTIPAEPVEFTGSPNLTLCFHAWSHGEGWKNHVPKLRAIQHRFDRLILGVAYVSSESEANTIRCELGLRWELVTVKNNPSKRTGLREVATYRQMLPMLPAGVNDVTFCAHAKAAQKDYPTREHLAWWTDAMYETVLCNIDGVLQAMRNGAAIVGSFRRFTQHWGSRFDYHFSGSFYAFRNCIAFSNGIPEYRQKWWGTESWPGDHFPVESSHCIFGDRCGDLYKVLQQPRKELEEWRKQRDIRVPGTAEKRHQ